MPYLWTVEPSGPKKKKQKRRSKSKSEVKAEIKALKAKREAQTTDSNNPRKKDR